MENLFLLGMSPHLAILMRRVGELYLERHRAVQTSQSRTKRNFRVSEHLIREAEYIATLASVQTSYAYPKEVSFLHQHKAELTISGSTIFGKAYAYACFTTHCLVAPST